MKKLYLLLDLAAGKQATQSSTYLGANRALDNDYNTYTRTNREMKPWWRVDLGIYSYVAKVSFVFKSLLDSENT